MQVERDSGELLSTSLYPCLTELASLPSPTIRTTIFLTVSQNTSFASRTLACSLTLSLSLPSFLRSPSPLCHPLCLISGTCYFCNIVAISAAPFPPRFALAFALGIASRFSSFFFIFFLLLLAVALLFYCCCCCCRFCCFLTCDSFVSSCFLYVNPLSLCLCPLSICYALLLC